MVHNPRHDDPPTRRAVLRPRPAGPDRRPPGRRAAQPRLHRPAGVDHAVGRVRSRRRGTPSRCRGCPGHGTTWQEMNTTTWADWYGEITRAFEKLSAENDVVVVGGLSMGARAGAAAGRGPRRPGRRRDRGQPRDRHQAPRREAAAGAQAPGAVVPGHRQRHQEARRRGARLHQDAAQGGALDDAGLADARRPTCRRSPRRCSTSARPRTTSSTRRPQPIITSGISSRDVTVVPLENSYHVATIDNDAEKIYDGQRGVRRPGDRSA